MTLFLIREDKSKWNKKRQVCNIRILYIPVSKNKKFLSYYNPIFSIAFNLLQPNKHWWYLVMYIFCLLTQNAMWQIEISIHKGSCHVCLPMFLYGHFMHGCCTEQRVNRKEGERKQERERERGRRERACGVRTKRAAFRVKRQVKHITASITCARSMEKIIQKIKMNQYGLE